jgi:opacity protein-like surface antigen
MIQLIQMPQTSPIIRKSTFALFLLAVLTAGSASGHAQVLPSAFRSPISLTVGGTASVFRPDYVPYKLGGVGAYVDLNIFHGVGIEAEGRWQRFNEFEGISQDNYLIGPRVKVLHIWRAQPYVKGLVGFTNMNFENNFGSGRFTTLAFGGGVDLKVTKRLSVRAIDFEYQYWPSFLGDSLKPYGASVGIGYRVF